MASPKSAAAKLGWKPGLTGWAFNRPEELAEALPFDSGTHAPDGASILIGFAQRSADLNAALETLLPTYERGKSLWFAYPKKTSPLAADLTRDKGWKAVAETGLIPVSQVAIDADWSAIRFRYRDEIARLTRQSDWPGA